MADPDLVRDPDNEEQPPPPRRRYIIPGPNRVVATREPPPPPPDMAETLPTTGAAAGIAPPPPTTLAERLQAREAVITQKLHPDAAQTRLGRFGRVMSTIGQDVGTALEPRVMESIPGTTANRRAELQSIREALGQEQAREAAAKEGQARTGIEKFKAESEATARGLPHIVPGEGHTKYPDPDDPDQRLKEDWEYQGQLIPEVPKGENPLDYRRGVQSATGGLPQGIPTSATPMPPAPTATLRGTGGAQTGGAQGTFPMATPTPAPAAPRAGGGGTYKPPDDETRFVGKYLKDNNLPNTADNVARAREVYKQGGSIGDAKAAQLMGQVQELLGPFKIDPRPYEINGRMTQPEAEERLKRAHEAEGMQRMIQAPVQQQRRKDERTPGYAIDDNRQTIYTNRADAEDHRWAFREVPPGTLEQDARLMRQLGDVQMNTSRYRKAIDSIKENIPTDQSMAMQRILSDAQLNNWLTTTLTMAPLMDMVSQGEKAGAWNQLKAPERDALIGYLRMRGAVITYMKALANSGRASERQFQVEEATIPAPFVGATVAIPQLDAVQENIDMASSGLPNNLVGIDHPKNIREKVEGARAAPPARGGGAPPPGARIRKIKPDGTVE